MTTKIFSFRTKLAILNYQPKRQLDPYDIGSDKIHVISKLKFDLKLLYQWVSATPS